MEKALPIKLLILDIDGTLTDGILRYGSTGVESRDFHVHDGMGLKLLRQSGVAIAVISAKQSAAVAKRLADLQIEHIYQGCENKIPAYEELKKTFNLNDNQIACMGDDLPDLPLLIRAGFAISVPNAPEIILQHVDYISQKKPGKGAVREVCEAIMKAQGTYEGVIQSYLELSTGIIKQ